MFPDVVMHILEMIGTISFAVSGAFVAIKARLDIFGVAFIGAMTAVGGGIARDMLIGRLPPAIFSNLHILVIAAASAVIVFIIVYVHRKRIYAFDTLATRVEHINNFFDAVGLGVFSVMGTEVAISQGFSENVFLCIVLGALTGVGGGIFRDVLTSTTPYVLKKHVYALASIGGSAIYYAMRVNIPDAIVLSSAAATVFVIAVRLLAAKYRWSLPKVRFEEKTEPSEGALRREKVE